MKAAAIGQSEDLARPTDVLNPSAVVKSMPESLEFYWKCFCPAEVLFRTVTLQLRYQQISRLLLANVDAPPSFNLTVASCFETMVTEGTAAMETSPFMFTDKSTDNQSTWQKKKKVLIIR